tara:strand:+ start:58 stop:657 length:600 start_codon:yes stop_codon:yes gene_type:complete
MHTRALVILCVLLMGCDSSDLPEPNPSDISDASACMEAGDCDPIDDTSPTSDAQGGPEDTERQSPEPEPLFELGTNVTGANTPDSFSPLLDGDELNIELGFQGLWMVVLAFRTRDIFKGKVTIIARIRVDDELQGEIGLAKQTLIAGGNGLDYYYNLFLVVMEPSVAGSQAEIEFSAQDQHDARIEQNLQVQLTGGTSG